MRSRGARLLPALLAAALVVGGCKPTARPGWTYAPAPATVAPPVASPGPQPSNATVAVKPSVAPSSAPSSRPMAAPGPITVPILYYHRVGAPPRGFARWAPARRERFLTYDVVPAAFEAQLDWLVERGYTTILPRDLAAYWDDGRPLPDRPVIISFDDGTRDWAEVVLPRLRERGMVAEFYVTLQALTSGGISWPELRELAAAGNGIGAHGLHHRQLAGFGRSRPAAGEAEMRREVQRPMEILAEQLGIAPDSYSYVGGGNDATLRRLVQEAGYTTARSILRGRAQDVSHRYLLRVIRVGSRLDVRDIVSGALVPGLPGFSKLIAGAAPVP